MSIVSTPQFRQGMDVETYLDDYFNAAGYRIERATPHEERQLKKGDRQFYKNHHYTWVEYKSGVQTFYTGNVFLETISVDTHNIPGWVYTCQADTIIYAAILNKQLLLFDPDYLRARIEDLKQRYPTVKTSKGQNVGYNTHGVIVPLAVAETDLAYKTIRL